MSETLETKPVYFHDCPALGPNARVPRALLADKTGTYVLAYQHKCPLCGCTAGEMELGVGVTYNLDGTCTVDITKAEKLQ